MHRLIPARKPTGAFRVMLALALLAVCARALLPFGLMLEARSGQGIAVVLCGTQGPTMAWLDPDSLELREDPVLPGPHAELPHPPACVFAASAMPALGTPALAFPAPSAATQHAGLQPWTIAPERRAATPWPTGPPGRSLV